MFSDHDDIWNKDKVEKSLRKLKEKDVDMALVSIYLNFDLNFSLQKH